MKTLYNLVALVAIANLLVIGGLAGSLVISGKLNSQTASIIAAVLRGEKYVPASPTTTSAPAAATSQPVTRPAPAVEPKGAVDTIERQEALLEQKEIALERRYSRLKDAEMKLIQDREALAQKQEAFDRQLKLQKQASEDEGFAKALALYTQMAPKLAKEDFMKLDTDIVVRYLMNMPKRGSTKILQEFKTAEEQKRRQELIERIRTQQEMLEQAAQKGRE
jgi:hypothetical protein